MAEDFVVGNSFDTYVAPVTGRGLNLKAGFRETTQWKLSVARMPQEAIEFGLALARRPLELAC